VEVAWYHAAECIDPFREYPLSSQLYFTGSTQASTIPVPELVLPVARERAPHHLRKEFSVDSLYFTLPLVQSSITLVVAEWLKDKQSALVAQESSESVVLPPLKLLIDQFDVLVSFR